jgi:hypothetical protein
MINIFFDIGDSNTDDRLLPRMLTLMVSIPTFIVGTLQGSVHFSMFFTQRWQVLKHKTQNGSLNFLSAFAKTLLLCVKPNLSK